MDFLYGDGVTIKEGFYKGLSGVILAHRYDDPVILPNDEEVEEVHFYIVRVFRHMGFTTLEDDVEINGDLLEHYKEEK
jgi:hypothetical protein